MTFLFSENTERNLDQDIDVQVPAGGIMLSGCLHVPKQTQILVILAHSHDDARSGVRNRYVTGILHANHIGTLHINLLTPEEEQLDEHLRELHFDTLMLAGRIDRIVEWLRVQPLSHQLKLAYFCSGTCAGAALIACAQHPGYILTAVCFGGRPDLADSFLPKVKAPILLLVGENDELVMELNRKSILQLNKQSSLVVIPGATHAFEEPGALEDMTHHAVDWFTEQAAAPEKDQDTSASL